MNRNTTTYTFWEEHVWEEGMWDVLSEPPLVSSHIWSQWKWDLGDFSKLLHSVPFEVALRLKYNWVLKHWGFFSLLTGFILMTLLCFQGWCLRSGGNSLIMCNWTLRKRRTSRGRWRMLPFSLFALIITFSSFFLSANRDLCVRSYTSAFQLGRC